MKTMTVEEFKRESNIEIIMELMKNNNGYITSKMVTELGLSREYLNILQEKNIIEKIDRGIYLDVKEVPDVYYVFQLKYSKCIFSHMTALYFYNLTEVFPNYFDITVDYNYHVDSIDKNHDVFKTKKEYLDIGLTTIETPFGNKIRVYDPERCICDIIKCRKKLDFEQVKKSVRMYLKSKNISIDKLSSYAKKMGIYNDVINFVGMYYE